MPSQTTLKDVAKLAGVSAMTVSRCIRNQPDVSPTTRKQVEAAIRELNYNPNHFLSMVMKQIRRNECSNPTANLAFLTFGESTKAAQQHLPTQVCFEGAQKIAKECGFSISQIWVDDPKLSGPRLTQLLQARGCVGILVGPLIQNGMPAALKGFDWSQFSSVSIGFFEHSQGTHVATHQYHLMQLLLKECRNTGFNRIGLSLQKSTDARVGGQWTSAYLHDQWEQRVVKMIPIRIEESPETTEAIPLTEWAFSNKIDIVLTDRLRSDTAKHCPFINMFDHVINLPDGSQIERDFIGIGATAARKLISYLTTQRGFADGITTELVDPKLKFHSSLTEMR